MSNSKSNIDEYGLITNTISKGMGMNFLSVLSEKIDNSLDKFKDNLSKVDNETQQNYLNSSEKILVEIKPEIKIYNDILPIFRTMLGIITKQQDEIKTLQNKGNYNICGVVH